MRDDQSTEPEMSPSQTLQNQLTAWFMRRTAPSGVRRISSLSAAVASEVGIVRPENQDRVAIVRGRDQTGRPFALIALADGIGGMQDGALCAAMTLGSLFAAIVDEASAYTAQCDWLLRCVNKANAVVHAKYRGQGGSTLVAVLLTGDRVTYWASVGDSRVYYSHDDMLARLSTDDTIAGQLGKGLEADPDQAKLLQFIGVGTALEPNLGKLGQASDGRMLLTSDGVHFLDTTPWFGMIVNHAPDPGLCVRRLTDLAKACGGPDNASAALIDLDAAFAELVSSQDAWLEVWDPFGDLQIILDSPKPAPQQPIRPPSNSTIAASDATAEKTFPAASPAAIKEHQRKTRKPRNQRKSKAKDKPSKSEDEGVMGTDEVPQLLMEFPNKNS